jgi:hypothetical protein
MVDEDVQRQGHLFCSGSCTVVTAGQAAPSILTVDFAGRRCARLVKTDEKTRKGIRIIDTYLSGLQSLFFE